MVWCFSTRVSVARVLSAHPCISRYLWVNKLRPRDNGRHFTDDIFKCIFMNENLWIPVKISLKFVPKGPINNIPALVQTMACRQPGRKPLSETMMVRLPTHICVTRPQWVNNLLVCWIYFRKYIKHLILYHFLTLIWYRYLKCDFLEGKGLFILHIQYHVFH